MEKKVCDGKCLKCKYHNIVPDPDQTDWFNSDDLAMFCTNPKNNMFKEWPSLDQQKHILSNQRYKLYIDKGYTYICGMMRPYELDEIEEADHKFANGGVEL